MHPAQENNNNNNNYYYYYILLLLYFTIVIIITYSRFKYLINFFLIPNKLYSSLFKVLLLLVIVNYHMSHNLQLVNN